MPTQCVPYNFKWGTGDFSRSRKARWSGFCFSPASRSTGTPYELHPSFPVDQFYAAIVAALQRVFLLEDRDDSALPPCSWHPSVHCDAVQELREPKETIFP
ncbi:hypothetical protein Y032_0044g905 [Ancylostoma ceylanicum]|uniref:Uncharacterized protein n=1 Tax=Ancylostoma ceylanicum TaxID=53326 RepID=A0A016UFA1_9BILA|nr:hypothetical protein Y032_0044g905 [Ancylostoma ceylanicum]